MTAAHQSPAQSRRQKRILSSGQNSALLKLRNSFLQTAGYQVITTKESDLLLEIASKQDFDAIVLCSSIPVHIQERLARELRALKPNTPLILICSYDAQQRLRPLADRIVIAEHGVSQPLIEAVFELAGDPEPELNPAAPRPF